MMSQFLRHTLLMATASLSQVQPPASPASVNLLPVEAGKLIMAAESEKTAERPSSEAAVKPVGGQRPGTVSLARVRNAIEAATMAAVQDWPGSRSTVSLSRTSPTTCDGA